MSENRTTPSYAEVIQINRTQESTLGHQQEVHACPVELATQINDAEYLNSHEPTGDDEIQNAQLVGGIGIISLLRQISPVFQQSESRERRHRTFQEKLINLRNTVVADATLPILLIFYLSRLLNSAMYSGAGAAMLKSLFHSYNVQEAVWAVLIGSAIWSPVIIFFDYIIVQLETERHPDRHMVSWLFQGIVIPPVGWAILKSYYDVEMTVFQHAAALWLGSGTLFLPLGVLELGAMYLYNREYSHQVEDNDDGALRADALSSQLSAAHTSQRITNDQLNLSNIVSDGEKTASDPDQLVESEAIRCIL